MKKQKGFTLIELMIVVAIIGILASVILTNLGKARNKAKDAAIMSEMSNLRAYAEMSASDNNDSYEKVCDDSSTINSVKVGYCNDDANYWVAYKDLIADPNHDGYCVDYMGTAKKVKDKVTSGDNCPDQ